MTITIEKAQHLLAQQPESTKQGLPDVGVCIQCLASYNQGIHHWVWVDLEVMAEEEETLGECIEWMLASSPVEGAEEWMFSDSCGLPSFAQGDVDQNSVIAYVMQLIEVPEAWRDAYRACCDYLGETVEAERFEEMFLGERDAEAYVEECYEESGELENIPSALLCNIDWEGVAQDWKLNGDIFEVGCWLFRGHV